MRQSTKFISRAAGTHHRVPELEILEQRLVLATITVTTAQDSVNFNDGATSLREAIFAANVVPGPDTIEFDPSLAGQTIRLTQGELSITDNLSIQGLGADKLTIDANDSDPTPNVKNGDGSRIFDIDASQSFSMPAFSVSISGLSLTGGDAAGPGGAVFSSGSLQITACNIHDNAAVGDGGGVFAGQSFSNTMNVVIENSRFTNNSSNAARSYGGAIAVNLSYYTGNVAISNCDISGNSAIAAQPLGDFVGGWAYGGGVSVQSDGEIDISNNRINQNSTQGSWAWGGGLYVESQGNANISNNQFDQNAAVGNWAWGGGVAIESERAGDSRGEPLIITGNSLTANSASGSVADGGGLYLKVTDLLTLSDPSVSAVLSDNTISSNTAKTGGGVSLDFWTNGAPVQLVRNEIDRNTALDDGGGLYSEFIPNWGYAVTEISECTFYNNTAQNDGGGVFSIGDLSLSDSTFSENRAGEAGGAVFSSDTLFSSSSAEVNRCTISGNTATIGGGIWGRALTINNTIVAENSTALGPQDLAYLNNQIYLFGAPSPEDLGVQYEIHYSLVGTNKGIEDVLTEAPVGAPDENGNLIGGATFGPINPVLGALAYDGGGTMTQSPLASSPVINRGDPLSKPGVDGVPTFDQRGAPFLRVAYGRIDIGAAEFQLRPPAIQGDYNRDSVVDGLDYILWRLNEGKQVANFSAADGSGDGDVGSEDYTAWRSHFGQSLATTASLAIGTASATAEKADAVPPPLKSPGISLVNPTQFEHQQLGAGKGNAPAIIGSDAAMYVAPLQSRNDALETLAAPRVSDRSILSSAVEPLGVADDKELSVCSLDVAFEQLSNQPIIPALVEV